MTEEQKFYFDALIRREIEAEDRMDAKSKFLERVNRENKEDTSETGNQDTELRTAAYKAGSRQETQSRKKMINFSKK